MCRIVLPRITFGSVKQAVSVRDRIGFRYTHYARGDHVRTCLSPTPTKSISSSAIKSDNEELCAGGNELNLRRKLLVAPIVPWLLSPRQTPTFARVFHCVQHDPPNEHQFARHRLELEARSLPNVKTRALTNTVRRKATEGHRAGHKQNKI